jgi:geranylgeranyl reductase family protein
MNDHYDTIVMGGGPAGSTVAALVAEAGFSTLLVEREKMPRFHVGESLMPETFWVFQRLGVLEKLQRSSFVRKVSVQFVSHTGRHSQPFFFPDHDPRDCSRTWQVDRAEFDKLLFDHAAEKGAETCDQTRVLDVLLEGDRATGVRLQTADGQTRTVRAQVVVDATGQQSLIANRLHLKHIDPQLRKVAIWGYYRKAQRDPGDHGGATIILHTQEKKSWFWFIPLSNGVTSIGVVGDADYLLKDRGEPSEIFEDELVRCPALTDRLLDAELVSQFRVAREFSYTVSQGAGNGWVCVGDAAGFIDPIYSSGVYFALVTGQSAADAITEGLARGDVTQQQLGKWLPSFREGAQWIRRLVEAFYTNEFSFGRFLRDHPQHQANLTDLLIGRVFYDGAGKLFQDMDAAMAQRKKLDTSATV